MGAVFYGAGCAALLLDEAAISAALVGVGVETLSVVAWLGRGGAARTTTAEAGVTVAARAPTTRAGTATGPRAAGDRTTRATSGTTCPAARQAAPARRRLIAARGALGHLPGTYTAPVRDPAIGEILVQPDQLARRVRELGAEISQDYAGRNPVLVGVLKGAVFFLSDLMRHIDVPCELDFMAVASYGSATDSSGVVRILKDLDAAIEDRDVLIVEDIVDSGLTLQYLLRNLGARDPAHAGGVRAADQARPAQGGPAHPLRGLRDPRPVCDRLRAGPR